MWPLVIAILLIVFLLRECRREIDRAELIAQLKGYELQNKQFEVERTKDSATIAYQNQTLLTQAEANRLGLLEMDKKMKSLQSQVKQETKVQIVEKPVPFIPDGFADTTGMVRDASGNVIRRDSIAVPVRFGLNEKWFQIKGLVNKDGLKIDTLTIPNKTVISVGYKKSGFLNLGKQAVVSAKNDNPYLEVTSMNNVVVKQKKNNLVKVFAFALGIFVGAKIK